MEWQFEQLFTWVFLSLDLHIFNERLGCRGESTELEYSVSDRSLFRNPRIFGVDILGFAFSSSTRNYWAGKSRSSNRSVFSVIVCCPCFCRPLWIASFCAFQPNRPFQFSMLYDFSSSCLLSPGRCTPVLAFSVKLNFPTVVSSYSIRSFYSIFLWLGWSFYTLIRNKIFSRHSSSFSRVRNPFFGSVPRARLAVICLFIAIVCSEDNRRRRCRADCHGNQFILSWLSFVIRWAFSSIDRGNTSVKESEGSIPFSVEQRDGNGYCVYTPLTDR